MAALPPALRAAVTTMLEGRSRRAIAARAQATSAGYRAGAGSSLTIRDAVDVTAYLVTRLPATFAAITAALREVATLTPAFAPTSIIDVACGPGTASFAAAEIWSTLREAAFVDANAGLLGAAHDLMAGCTPVPYQQCAFLQGDAVTLVGDADGAELCIVGYGLVEMSPSAGLELVRALWRKCSGVLVLVEPGTTPGFARIRAAREALLALGAHVIAPCPHEAACPMPEGDWCHFTQRLPRLRDHMIAKAANVPFEDEKYAYLAVAHAVPPHRPAARILRPATLAKSGWTGSICTDGTIRTLAVGRRQQAFGHVRKRDWGASLEADALLP